ncbi:hypothetical protein CYMTET_9367 [Cymbomonas tetramitiformis]|uniref:Pyridine nucleotide-disulfide oxidoreductase n=1 Tax=Cymbomonas tetramitiformis TaxID=36881 RepID=A0AAE0LF32_9CHLO|nr:hypothetical protein CYMTET_9367 [Cymbomonas tetramitiformis]
MSGDDNSEAKKYQDRLSRMAKRWVGEKDVGTEVRQLDRTRSTHRLERIARHVAPVPSAGAPDSSGSAGYVHETRQVPVAASCEVLVVGGGPSGLSAALGARRAGANTMIVERFGCFGGTISTVGMETIGWYRYEGTVDEGNGIGMEMERQAERMGGSTKFPYNDSMCLNAEEFKFVADRLVSETGVRPRLHSMAVDAIVVENTIKGVIVESKSGREAIMADRVIDCTGDADVAYFSGARFSELPLEKNLGVTPVFNVKGVDKTRFREYVANNAGTYEHWVKGWDYETSGKETHLKSPMFSDEMDKARADNVIPEEKDVAIVGSWSTLSEEGEVQNLNLVHLTGLSCTNVEHLTQAEMKGREQARFSDSIGIFPEFLDGYNILVLPTTGRYMQVPYGCLVPDVDNLLVAGRCVSGDAVSHSMTRNMMCCTVTGQGAGVAVAISVRLNQSTKSVDIKKVQAELVKQGVRIE